MSGKVIISSTYALIKKLTETFFKFITGLQVYCDLYF